MRRMLLGVPALLLCAGALSAQSSAGGGAQPAKKFDTSAIDKAVNPCINFYEFSCGTWRKNNPIPADRPAWGRGAELQERNLAVLHQILEKVSDPKAKRNALEAKVGDEYGACMDEATAEAKGTKPIAADLARIHALKNRAELIAYIAAMHNNGTSGLFSFGAGTDLKDSNKITVNFDQGGISLPDREYYLKTDAKSIEAREKYVAHVTRMFELLGDPSPKAAAEAKTVLAFETELAKGYMDRVERRNPVNRDHKMPFADLQKMAPNFELARYIQAEKVPAFTEVNVGNPGFFKQVNETLAKTSLEDLKTYLRWRVLTEAAPYLSARFVSEDFDFFNHYLNGTPENQPRWKRCVRQVDNDLGEALGRLFVAKTFGAEGKARMQKQVENLTVALRKDIQNLDWMTEPTKEKALQKLAAFHKKIGYPDKWRDYSSVKITREDLLGNVRRSNAFEVRRNRNKIGKPTDKSEWGMTPPTVNAYHNPPFTEIVFPAGILQPPFFDKESDDAVNYGAIGSVIGHEYTHGFDDQGRKFDLNGNLADWWTPEDAKAFEERASCIADEYSGFYSVRDKEHPENDVHLNGKLTLGENIGDNGGVRVAYMAYIDSLTPAQREEKIDGYTPEQRFFIAYGNVWCQNIKEQRARTLAQTDPHSTGEFRTNGVVSNMPEFGKAFGCKQGQPMVRDKQCRVW